jgi:hypothetical protein
MIEAKVPVVPGYHGENQDPEHLKQQAASIGCDDATRLCLTLSLITACVDIQS